MNTADLYLKPWETRHCEPPLDPPDEYWGIEKEEEDEDAAIARWERIQEYKEWKNQIWE